MAFKTITAENTFEPVRVGGDGAIVTTTAGAGTTVSVQMKRWEQDDTGYFDIATWTTAKHERVNCGPGWDIRIGVKTGNYGASVTVGAFSA